MSFMKKLFNNKTAVMWAAVALLFIVLTALVSLTSAVVMAVFFAFLILKVERGAAYAASFVLLLISAFFLAMKQNTSASALAEWSYFFLAIGIILQLIDYLGSSGGAKAGEKSGSTSRDAD